LAHPKLGADGLFLDNFENFGVTADCNKVLPGMVYVDLLESKGRKELYHAYKNGASVIYTTQNISDPELPVIKVDNVQETMLLLLDTYFKRPQNKIKLVAVSGSRDKDLVMDLLYKMLCKGNPRYEHYLNSIHHMSIEDMYEYINNLAAEGDLILPLIMDYKLKYFEFARGFSFDCALITSVNSIDIKDAGYVLNGIRSFATKIAPNKPIIINNDDPMLLKAVEANKDTLVITYGLNKKATVTATSIDINIQTTFHYCLQRSFTTNRGQLLEPFEMPVTMNVPDSKSIYNALGAITCALYYDVDIEHIQDVLKAYKPPHRRFELIAHGEVTLLDNCCSGAGELDKLLEATQGLNFQRIKMILSIHKSGETYELQNILEVLGQWSGVLRISDVVFCGCMDIDSELQPLSIQETRYLSKSMTSIAKMKYFDKLKDAAEFMRKKLEPGDLVILAGGHEMNGARSMMTTQIHLH
jgi:UDP-N-acetylmuramoyl-L-alanyl-D-glutamate--2,6-diaminopimelate ligase